MLLDVIKVWWVTFFLEDPSVRYKQYKTTAGMYINKSATRTGKEEEPYVILSIFHGNNGFSHLMI